MQTEVKQENSLGRSSKPSVRTQHIFFHFTELIYEPITIHEEQKTIESQYIAEEKNIEL